MAQAEDTELRDLVIEALEKNGSLAKIRALLRANIFLAFEDECETMKQNLNLDNILKLPEGVLALTIVHEFLEFCNLKNTLFVYMSESRQGRDYAYEGRDTLAERLHIINGSHNAKEPVLLTFIKNILRPYQRKYYDQGDAGRLDKHSSAPPKDDQNCTYIVHEDSSASTSHSNSDNSSDEKNKLHLKLPLDNSDTDTSSDSTREKSSEYIPNQHILAQPNTDVELSLSQPTKFTTKNESNLICQSHIHELKGNTINSSDSTSYVDIKSYKATDFHVPSLKVDVKNENSPHQSADKHHPQPPQDPILKGDSVSSTTLNSIASLSQRNDITETDDKVHKINSKSVDDRTKSDTEATEYSLDFTSSPTSRNKNMQERHFQSPERVQDNMSLKDNASPNESPRQNSQSSQSSVSISDVADLIEYSDRHLYDHSLSKENLSINSPSNVSHKPTNMHSDQNKPPSDDSADFSESPVPSLSNLSLDIHSD